MLMKYISIQNQISLYIQWNNFFFVSPLKVFSFEIIQKDFLFLNQLIFLLPTDKERNSQLSKIVRKKIKNYYLIKLVSKWKGAIIKGHTSFFKFDFWNFKLVSIDSTLDSASGMQTNFYQKCGRGTKKNCQTWKFRLKFIKWTFRTYIKTGKGWNQLFFALSCPGIARMQLSMSNFDFDPWMGDHALLPEK